MIRLNNGIACDFGATHGLWYWTQAGGWQQWNTANPDKMIAVDIDGYFHDELIVSFLDYGLYIHDPDNTPANQWTRIKQSFPKT
jgi:hypothetical protein